MTRIPARWRAVVGLAAGALLVWFVVATVGGLRDAAAALGRMQPAWVAVAVVAGAGRMAVFVTQIRAIGRRVGHLGWREATEVGLLVYGVGAVLPASPAEGLGAAAVELRHSGRSRRETALVLALSEWFTQRGFYAVAAVDLLMLVALGRLPWSDTWPFVTAGVVVLVILVVTARLVRRPATAELAAQWAGALRWHHTVRPAEERRRHGRAVHDDAMAVLGPRSTRWRLGAISVAAALVDAATLAAACAGAGLHVDPAGVVLAAVVGTVATWVPLLPAGLGLVELGVPLVLHRLGAPLDDAFAATVIHRAAGTLLPAAAGAVAAAMIRYRRAAR